MNLRLSTSLLLATSLAIIAVAQVDVAASANGGIASQSSDYSSISTADKANDGDRQGNYSAANNIAHTGFESGAFWESSFATAAAIDTVNVFNRTDGFGERINPFNVILYLGLTEVYSATNQTFIPTITGPQISGMSFMTNGVIADRVRIQLAGSNYLQLAEVEAFSSRPVPEPASIAALGMGAFALMRRRKARTAA
ncbi:PEP-CTERM sorting domain-containing protein [bacterium]|nr:MAG: PEP-CTERM sorting domain-containing protein [bacterium]